MQVFFKNAKMSKVAADIKTLNREYGQSGKWIAKCLNALRAAPNLAELFKPFFRSFRCHLLHNDKKGKYSLDERDPYRVLFEPKPPVPKKEDGGIDVDKVDTVVVTDLHIDTHE